MLLLDINMPEMSRFQDCSLPAPAQNEHSGFLPLIFVTARTRNTPFPPSKNKPSITCSNALLTAERLGEALNRAAQRTASRRTMKLFGTLPMLRATTPPAVS